MVSPAEKPEDTVFIWVVRVAGPLGTAWAAWATVRSPAEEKLKDRLRAVRPTMDANCPLCNVMLFPSEPAWQCPRCGIRRRALPAA
jgi:rubrerythrin